jgi:ribosomal protection tetracycline resistance protein
VQRQSVAAGGVAKLWGLADVQIGDRIGESAPRPRARSSRRRPGVGRRREQPDDRARLRSALTQLAEQDPLINVQQNEVLNEDSVSLYGEGPERGDRVDLETDFGLR